MLHIQYSVINNSNAKSLWLSSLYSVAIMSCSPNLFNIHSDLDNLSEGLEFCNVSCSLSLI